MGNLLILKYNKMRNDTKKETNTQGKFSSGIFLKTVYAVINGNEHEKEQSLYIHVYISVYILHISIHYLALKKSFLLYFISAVSIFK